jgi:FKBP-type peptidyl-prolyl cis-trans isomerase FkpA
MKAVLTQLQTEVRASNQEAKAHEAGAGPQSGRGLPRRKQEQRRSRYPAQRLAVQDPDRGHRTEAHGNDTVTCNYRGTLISGKEFDSSYKRGQPAIVSRRPE